MKCSECGNELKTEWQVCPYCGAQVDKRPISATEIKDSVVKEISQSQTVETKRGEGAVIGGGIHIEVGEKRHGTLGSAELEYEEYVLAILHGGGNLEKARPMLEGKRRSLLLSLKQAKEIETACLLHAGSVAKGKETAVGIPNTADLPNKPELGIPVVARPEAETSVALSPNTAGLLCYVAGWITGIVFVVLEKKSSFVKFHAWQSIATFGTLTIALLVFGAISEILVTLLGVLMFVLWIILMVQAGTGNMVKVPWAGDWAEKQASKQSS